MQCLSITQDICPEPFLEFAQVYNIVDAIKDKLNRLLGTDCENQTIEKLVFDEGKHILNAIHQAYFDALSMIPFSEPIVDSDSVVRKHIRKKRTRKLQGIHGEVTVTQTIFRRKSCSGMKPLEGHLNLPKDRYSFALKKQAVSVACTTSFENTQHLLEELTGNTIPKRQLEEILRKTSKDFSSFYELSSYSEEVDASELLILTFDGKGIKMVPNSLREQTRKAANEKKKRSGSRLGKGEKTNKKRMAQVASIYQVMPHARCPDDIISALRRTEKTTKSKRPQPRLKRVFASVERSSMQVISEGVEEAQNRDPDGKMKWFVLVDGDSRQIKNIITALNHMNCKATIVMDFIHVAEYVWKAAHAIWGEKNDRRKEDWVFEKLNLILTGKAKKVSRELKREARSYSLNDSEKKAIKSCTTYIENHLDYLKYNSALEKGAPICTGIIEGACRYLIRDRMELTGCRWSLKGAEAMLCMRSIILSGDFDEYWEFHCSQEKDRNHLSNYKDKRLPNLEVKISSPNLVLIKGGGFCAQ